MDDTGEQKPATSETIRLKDDICALVASYQNATEPPPFSAADLVVMACCMNTDITTGLDIPEISQHILNTFPYFQKRALRHYAQMQEINASQGEEVEHEEIFDGFQDVFSRWEVPLVTRDDPHHEVYRWDEVGEDVYVPPQAGRIFLSRWLEDERKGTFPFLELPAELRNTVYEMVFSFPREGIVINGTRLEITRRAEQPVNSELFNTYVQGLNRDHRIYNDINVFDLNSRHLNLDFLRVNSQIHDEALPFFLRSNRFWCVGEFETGNFITRLPPRYAEHLQDLHINVGYNHSWPQDFPPAMKKLAQVKRLRRLVVQVNKDKWFGMREQMRLKLGRRSKFTKYEQIPGFKDLAVACSKAEVVEWSGVEYGVMRGWVEVEVSKLAGAAAGQEEEKGAGGGKRRARSGKGKKEYESSVEQDGQRLRKKAKKTGTSSKVVEDEE